MALCDIPPHLRPTREELLDAERTLYLLADQVGLLCARCGTGIKGHNAIGCMSYMALMGTRDYQARVYCATCAEDFRNE